MSEEENWDVTNEREFMKGILTALYVVLDIIEKERSAGVEILEMKIMDLYDRALNGFLNITESEWSEVLKLIIR